MLPTTHVRLGETLYLHGSTGSGPMLAAAGAPDGLPVCVTATLVDGLVLARSAMHHSLEFRSVVAVGNARLVRDDDEKRRALAALLDHVAPGRSTDSRPPSARELAATAVIALDLVEVSAKVRTGGPVDDPEDLTLPHWAGILPLDPAAGIADSRRRPRSGDTAAVLPRGLPPGLSAWIELCPTTPKSRGW